MGVEKGEVSTLSCYHFYPYPLLILPERELRIGQAGRHCTGGFTPNKAGGDKEGEKGGRGGKGGRWGGSQTRSGYE